MYPNTTGCYVWRADARFLLVAMFLSAFLFETRFNTHLYKLRRTPQENRVRMNDIKAGKIEDSLEFNWRAILLLVKCLSISFSLTTVVFTKGVSLNVFFSLYMVKILIYRSVSI